MKDADRAIVATLAYYGAHRRPLTAVELTERLIPPTRVGGSEPCPLLGAVVSRLDALVDGASVSAECGLYALAETPAGFGARRIAREKESAQKFRRMLRAAWWLQAVPFVRALAASGSLALASTSAESDWDMFVVARAGRLYTARAGLVAATAVMRRLRTKRMRTAPDRFCFNHYLTTDGLALRHRSMFTAHALAWLVPVIDADGVLPQMWRENEWVHAYTVFAGDAQFVRRGVEHSRALAGMRMTLEALLAGWPGATLERALRFWMQRRIRRDPAARAKGGRIIANDRELEFHPHSFEAVALVRYNRALDRFGLGAFAERDSGLAH